LTGIQWLDWSEASIELAQKKDRPILLSINGVWCGACHYMDRTTFSSPGVVSGVKENFVPIRVIMDERPDICERFNIGGFPSVVFLTPKLEVIYTTAYAPPQQFQAVLGKILESYRRGERLESPKIALERASPLLEASRGKLDEGIVQSVEKTVLQSYDEEYGGFLKRTDFPPGWNYAYRGFAFYSVEPKIPYPETIEFLLMRYMRTGKTRLLGMATKTLEAMKEGLQDSANGGFYRYADERDWSGPHTEKLVEVNAAILRAYVKAFLVSGDDAHLKTGGEVADFVWSTLQNAQGGFFSCVRPDGQVDEAIYTNWSASMASAYLEAAAALNRPELRAFALKTIDFLLKENSDPKLGMHHKYNKSPTPGTLSDQVRMATALMDAFEVTGQRRYLDKARSLVDLAVENLYDRTNGGFFDVKGSGSPVQKRIRPPIENSIAAELLVRLQTSTGEVRYSDLAQSTLEAFARSYDHYGHFSSSYASAVEFFLRGPFSVTILGPHDDVRSEAFRRWARAAYVPGRVIRPLDPEADADLIANMAYRIPEAMSSTPVAVMCFGNACSPPVKEPSGLPSVMVEFYKRALSS